MADTTITGVIHKIFDTQKISESFSKKEIVIKTDEPYPQYVPVQFVNKNIDKLSTAMEGKTVTVSYNLRGKEYNGKYFVSCDGWRIENVSFSASSQEQKEEEAIDKSNSFTEGTGDDLPF